MFSFSVIFLFSQTLLAASSNEKVVLQGRIIDSGGVAVTDSNVTFDIKVYSPSTGTAGLHCLLYEETQLLDMSNSGGTFALQIGTGSRVGSGPTLRETFTNASVSSFTGLTCGSGGSTYTPGAIDDRTIEMTVSFGAQNLALQAIPVKAVPFAFQANQIGGYSINNLVRLNGAGSATNLDLDQFNYLTGFFHDNGTNGTTTDDYLDAQSLLIKNVLAPSSGTDAANKTYVDNAVAGVSGSLPTLNSAKIWVGNSANAAASVSMSGDATIDNTGKVTVGGVQGKPVTLTSLASKDTLMYNGSAWVNIGIPTCSGSQYLTFDGTSYSCVTTTNSPTGASLAPANIWVGNASSLAAPVTMSGDVTMTDAGVTTIGKLSGTTLTTSSLSSGQVLQYNGSAWVNATLSASLPSLADTKIWVGNGSSVATAVSASGDVTLADTGAFAVTKLQGYSVSNTAPTSNQVLQYNGSSWVPTSLSATLPSLNSAQIWVGNGSSVATAVSASGDATIDNTGKITVSGLNGKAVSGTPTSSQVLQYNGSEWIPSTIVTAVTGSALNDATMWVGNAANTAQPVTMSGDVTMTDAGVTTIGKINGTAVSGVGLADGNVLQNNSGSALSGNTMLVTNGTGTGVTAVPAQNSAVMITGATGIPTWSTSATATGQVLQYNGSAWVPATISTSPTGQALNPALIWVGNASSLAAPVAVSGDASITNAGAVTVSGLDGKALNISSLTANQILQYNGSQWLNVTPNYQSTTLNSNNVWLGNASNIAAPAAMPTCSAGYYLTFNGTAFACALDAGSTGSVTSITATAPLAVDVSTGNVTASMTLTGSHVYVGNASNLAADVAMSGDATIDNTGKVTVGGLDGKAINGTATANQVLQYNGSEWVPSSFVSSVSGSALTSADIWVGNGSNLAVAVAPSGDVTMTNAGAFKVTQIQGVAVNNTTPTSNQVLQYNGSAWIPTSLSATLPSLSSAQIWVGNSSSVAVGVTASGDATIDNTGKFTVAGLSGTALNVSSLASNQVLQYNGSQWVNATLSTTPTGQALDPAQIWVGNASSLAAPVAMSGDATLSNAGALTVTGLKGAALNITSLTANQILQYNGSQWLNVTPNYQSSTLNDTQIWVGNGSNVAVGVAASGDVTLADTGAFTVAKLQAKTLTISSPSANQVLQYNGSEWVNATLSTSPVGQALNSAQIWVGNASNLATAVTAGGDVTLSNAGAFTIGKINGTTVSGVGLADGNVLQNNSGSALSGNTMLVTNGTGTGVTAIPAQNSAVMITGATGIPTWSTSATATGQVLQYNGSAWVPATISTTPTGQALDPANIWVGNASSLAAPVAMNGDVTISNAGATTVGKIQNSTVSISSPSANQILQYNGSAWINTSLSAATLPSLADAKIWIGNGSNVATAASASGDVTLSDTGVFKVTQLQGVAVNNTTPTSNQVLQYNGSQWIPTTLSTSPTGQALNPALIWVGNASSLAAPVAVSGDATISNAGAVTVTGLKGAALNLTSLSANQILQYNGSQWLNVTPSYQSSTLNSANIWVGNGSSVAVGVAASGDVTLANTGAFTVTGINGKAVSGTPTSNQVLQYNGSQWIPTTLSTSPVGQSLSAGNIWVGNASSVAASVAMSGDGTMSSAGALTVSGISGKAINGTATSGQVLQYNGSQWIPTTISSGTTISGGTQNYVAKFNSTGNNVVNSSITDDGTYVQSTKVFRGPTAISNSTTTIDFSTGNIQYTSASCGAMTLKNMKDGATYTLAVQGVTAGTCTFTAYSDSGSTTVSVLYPPDYAATTSTYQTLFSFVVVNTTAYVTWIPGYHP